MQYLNVFYKYAVIGLMVYLAWSAFWINHNLIRLRNPGNSGVTEIYNVHEHYNDFTILEKEWKEMPWREILK